MLSADPVSLHTYEQGEGPRLDPRTGELIFVDIAGHAVHRSRLSGGTLRPVGTYDLGAPVGAVAPLAAPGAGWLVAVADDVVHLAEDGTRTVLHTDLAADHGQLNDGACDPAGRFHCGSQSRLRRPVARLHRLDTDGSIHVALTGVTVSNGIGFTADGTTMYYIDTLPARCLDSFEVRPDGSLGHRRTVAPVSGGNPDGLAIDDEGCIWVAVWDGWTVHRYAPDGRLLTEVRLPVARPTAVAFAGSTLLVTTAYHGLDATQRVAQPDAGRIFAVDVGVGGPAAYPWRGRPPAR
ncbi:SMP-30/gluconolactonase/LRE family protein [Micromonospora sp. R77]|uniref:SMP-30/gluconolactonase/LRE family protein n=1 Tax=Micromonospora sp. R77 TaxID=2925836 RepID=UPI001F60D1AC|nr:SMP-30/gluconolactonase/LRE family protein [Micromonospora sp. R77]MCI4061326.1 SMP-30/gluconolactonase/LRE family protein [Micromonospora sp. R77]